MGDSGAQGRFSDTGREVTAARRCSSHCVASLPRTTAAASAAATYLPLI